MINNFKDFLTRGIRTPQAKSRAEWSGIVSAMKAAVDRNPRYHLYTHYPITPSGIAADMVVEGPEDVVVIEALRPMAGTAEVSTSALAMARMVQGSAQQLFPDRKVRVVYYPTAEVSESVRDATSHLGAEIAPAHESAVNFVRNIIVEE